MDYIVKSSVTMIVFNRYEKTLKVFEKVKKVKPKKLYVIADGPRQGILEDFRKCEKVRSIFENVDWDCEVIKNFSEKNLGCGQRVFTGLTWVFQREEKAIILEDDCLPDLTFFRFCDEVLDKYKNDERIMLVSGTNVNTKWETDGDSYHFSKLGGIHGWASWKRVWKKVDFEMELWGEERTKKLIREKFSPNFFYNRSKEYDKLMKNSKNAHTWDYQFGFSRLVNNGLAVVPSGNLITNIGFDEESSHTKNKSSKTANLQVIPIKFPLKHPLVIMDDMAYDKLFESMLYPTSIKSLISKAVKTLMQRK